MFKYIIKRLLGMIVVMFFVSVVVFFFIHLLPGDPAQVIAGPEATDADIQNIRISLGLDKSLFYQYCHFITNLLSLNLGTSISYDKPVWDILEKRYPVSLTLACCSLWFIPVGILIGVLSAVYKNKFIDYMAMTFAISGISIPDFWLGLLLMIVFSSELGWFNSTGYDSLKDMVLPAITLGTIGTAIIARFTRSAFLDILSENYINTARAKGLRETQVIWKHSFKNAVLPIITVVGLQVGGLMGGSIVVERIFSLPGLGSLLLDAVNSRDYPIIQVLLLLYSFHFIVINFMVDVLYIVINPQIRLK